MAQTIKLKRSSVAGKVPTTGQLEIGELALNSADGKVYFERGDTTVQSFFTTNTLITGSLQQSGSDSYFLSNVGIGTTTPQEKLHVDGNISGSDTYINDWGSVSASLALISGSGTSQTLQQVTDNGATTDNSITILGAANNFKGLLADTDINLTFGSTSGAQPRIYLYGTANGQATAGNIFIGTANNTGDVQINGNVGIGTTSPSTKLDVVGNATTALFRNQNSSGADTGIDIRGARNGLTDGVTSYIVFSNYDNKNAINPVGTHNLGRIYGSLNTADGNDGKITIEGYDGSGFNHGLTVASNGNVGIGTTSPDYTLNVIGTVGISEYLYHDNDNNTYLRFATDYAQLVAGGRNIIKLSEGTDPDIIELGDSATYTTTLGRVGIGTTSPSYKLDVNGSGRFTDDLITSGSLVVREGLTMYGGAANDSFVFTNLFKSSLFGKNNVIQFRQGGSTPDAIMFTYYDFNPMLTMIPNSAALAKVGINNADPQYSLDVSGSGNFTNGLTVTGSILHDGDLTVTGRVTAEEFHTEFVSASIVYQSGSTKFGDTSDDVHSFTGSIDISEGNLTLDTQKFLQFRNSVGTPVGTMTFNNSNELVIFNGNSTSGDIKFSDGSYTGTVNMLIEGSTGNVGIGTTSPQERLHVDGGGMYISGVGATNDVMLIGFTESTNYDQFAIKGVFAPAGGDNALKFTTDLGGGDILTMKGDGNVGIGTTSPSQKLHVAGNLRLTGAFYDSNNSAGTSNQILSSTGTGTDWVSLSEITGVDGTGAATQVTYWSDTDTVTGDGNFTWDGSTLSITGVLEASEKSFVIDHPTKQDYKLVYGALEGPEHGVYCRGRVPKNGIIELPEEWTGLVDEDTITVQLTPIGKHQNLYVEDIYDNKVEVKNGDLLSSKTNAFYFIQGTRKDVKPLQTLRKK